MHTLSIYAESIPRLALLLSALGLAGCQAYQAQPLDLAAHREDYLKRTADVAPVIGFARQLAEADATPAAFDITDGITLAEAQAVALFFNPDLRVARARAGVAAATAQTAGLWEDPMLEVDAERILSSVDKPWIIGATLGITLPISGRLEAEKARADAAGETELRRAAAMEWTVRSDLRRAWMEWSAATLRVALQQEFLTRLDNLLKLVEGLEKVGEYTRVDARVFRIERVTGATDLDLLESKAAQAELQIRGLMGLSSAAPIRLIPSTGYASATTPLQDRRTAMEARNPELAVRRAAYEQAEAALRKEIRAQYPDLTIGPGGGYEEGEARALLSLALPLPLWNRNQQGVAMALAERELSRIEAHTEYERLAIALDKADLDLRTATSQRQRIESQVVPMVDEQEADTRKLAAAGRLDPLLILDALTRQLDAKQRLIESRVNESIALIRLDELTGPAASVAAPSK